MSQPMKPRFKRARICHLVDGSKVRGHWMTIKTARDYLKSQSNCVGVFWIELDPSFTHEPWQPGKSQLHIPRFDIVKAADEAINKAIKQQFSLLDAFPYLTIEVKK